MENGRREVATTTIRVTPRVVRLEKRVRRSMGTERASDTIEGALRAWVSMLARVEQRRIGYGPKPPTVEVADGAA